MIMEDKTKAIYKLAVSLRAYDNAYPDIGPGWNDSHFIDLALKEMNWTKSEIYYSEVLKKMYK